jgi:aryl-alcohol dehydrogenase-like predicted oxidoreductase
MSQLALGCVQFGLSYGITNNNGLMSEDSIRDILMRTREFDIDLLDTASSYGNAESVLGQIGVSHFNIVTKLPYDKPDNVSLIQWLRCEVSASLVRLRVDKVYGLLFHNISQVFVDSPTTVRAAVDALKSTQQVTSIGVSVYSPVELDNVFKVFRPDIVQIPMNAFDRRFEKSGWLDRLNSLEVEVHVRSIYLQGLLLARSEDLPSQFIPWSQTFHSWNEFVRSNKITSTAAAIAAVRSHKISRLVVGVQSVSQLNELVTGYNASTGIVVPDFKVSDTRLLLPTEWK